MSTLPQGWAATTLGMVVDYGKTEKVEPENIAADAWILELEDIEKDVSKIVARFSFEVRKSKSTKNRFRKGDVLYGKLRPYLNKVVLADADGYATTEIVPIKPTAATDNRFIFHWLKGPRFLAYVNEVSHGLNMPRLGTVAGKQAPLLLAPLAEQTRIANKLDALLTRIEAARARLDRVPTLLKRFRQSVLSAATSGELTEDWRGGGGEKRTLNLHDEEMEVPTAWEISLLSGVINPKRPLCYGVVQPGKEVAGGVLLIRVQDMDNAAILTNELRTISNEVDQEYRRSHVEAGDVLVSVVGTIGRTAIVPAGLRANIARAIARIACSADACPGWVNVWLSSNSMQWWLHKSSKEVARKTLNLSDLAVAPIAVPPREEQVEIVQRVEALFALADKVQAQYDTAKARFEKLTPALLAKAFRGDLVPQDPNDEPAEKLLERLRASQPGTEKSATKGRKAKAGKR